MGDISKVASFFGVTLPGAKRKEMLEKAATNIKTPSKKVVKKSVPIVKKAIKDTSKEDRATLVNSLGTRVNPLIAQDKAKSAFTK